MGPRKKIEPADYAIVSTILTPVLFDFIAWRKNWKTVSVRWGNFLEDPKTRMIVVAGWIILSLHLFWRLPLPFQSSLKRLIIGGKK